MFKASLVTIKGVGDLMSYQLPKKELYIFTHNKKKLEKPLAHTIYVEIWLKVCQNNFYIESVEIV